MCGIAGLWAFDSLPNVHQVGQAMTRALLHRGPDSDGQWSDSDTGVCLGHSRLAILDISPAGAQPMHSHCDRYSVTYNGELYNHTDIRSQLEQHDPSLNWTGNSDTETLLAAISAWGFEKALESFTGMYAIALWDKKEKCLSLARDRMGEKPLYYGWVDGSFVFASELKAIRKHPNFKALINTNALQLFIEKACVPAPLCIFEGLYKLPPASWISINSLNDLPDPITYWSLDEKQVANEPQTDESQTQQWLTQLDDQLTQSVQKQMASDVPLGAFLSGGYDSSLIVAMMQKNSTKKVKTFSIGFDNPEYDEAPYAKVVAEHLGTEHQELYVSADDALNLVPSLPIFWDEPFADPSQLPTYMVAAMTREHVTVALSGDGGDELFCGYTRYAKAAKLWDKVSKIPEPFRGVMDSTLAPFVTRQLHRLTTNKDGNGSYSNWVGRAERINRRLHLCGSDSREKFYARLLAHDGAIESIVKSDKTSLGAISKIGNADVDYFSYMMHIDINDYLHNTILTKVDRAAMAVSLETRAPLLDHNLAELAWSMPLDMKVRDGQSKWCLKSVVHQYVPKTLMDRPKKGFGIPLAQWLRGPLKGWADDLLSSERLERDGYFHTNVVRSLWTSLLAGNGEHERVLWNVLMFQAWLATLNEQ